MTGKRLVGSVAGCACERERPERAAGSAAPPGEAGEPAADRLRGRSPALAGDFPALPAHVARSARFGPWRSSGWRSEQRCRSPSGDAGRCWRSGSPPLRSAIATAIGQSFAPDPLIAVPMYQVASVRERRESLPRSGPRRRGADRRGGSRCGHPPSEGDATFSVLLAIAAWFVGDSVRVRRAYTAGLAEQAAQRPRETVERAQRERRRGAAAHRPRAARRRRPQPERDRRPVRRRSPRHRRASRTRPKQALAAVETTSRSALDELRRMLGVLRRRGLGRAGPHTGARASPTSGALVEQIRATGIPVELRIDGSLTRRDCPHWSS